MRRLIINADDFGFTDGVNRAILEAYQSKVVTSASLMAGGPAFAEAVTLARSAPGLAVGCHLVFIGGSPVLPASGLPSLAPGGTDFRGGWLGLAGAALRGKLNEKEIEAEATAQIRKLQSAGVEVSHVDTHKHVHIFPQVLGPVLRAARACGVRAIRNPFEPVQPALLARKGSLWRRWLGTAMLRNFAGAFGLMVSRAGLVTTRGTFGIVATGAMDAQLLQCMVEHLPEGTWELVCHPGYDDAQLRNMPTQLWAAREDELKLWLSPATCELLARKRIELISFRDLVQP